MLCKCYEVYEGHIKFDKDKNTSFPKKSVENTDLYKSELIEVMTKHE